MKLIEALTYNPNELYVILLINRNRRNSPPVPTRYRDGIDMDRVAALYYINYDRKVYAVKNFIKDEKVYNLPLVNYDEKRLLDEVRNALDMWDIFHLPYREMVVENDKSKYVLMYYDDDWTCLEGSLKELIKKYIKLLDDMIERNVSYFFFEENENDEICCFNSFQTGLDIYNDLLIISDSLRHSEI